MSNRYSALIIGGGIAGLQASLDLANYGFQVYLIEKQPNLGGTVKQLSKLFPTLQDAEEKITPIIDKVASDASIKIFTQAEVENVEGSIRNFKVKIRRVPGSDVSPLGDDIHADAIIITTGFQQYDVKKIAQYKYGHCKNVITGLEYERLCRLDGPTKGKIVRIDNGAEPKSVVYVLCVGSRDEKHLRHCCNIGCLNVIKHAYFLRKQYGREIDAYICYTDIRAVTKKGEQFYQKVRASEVEFIHGQPSEIRETPDGSLVIDVYDQATSKLLSIVTDLIVLEAGLLPQVDLSEKLKLPLDEDGFFREKDAQLATNETSVSGIFLAGAVQQPMHSYEAVVSASAAALRAMSAVRMHKG